MLKHGRFSAAFMEPLARKAAVRSSAGSGHEKLAYAAHEKDNNIDSVFTMSLESRKRSHKMKLGAFSISLAVKDIAASRAFRENLGLGQVLGDQTQNWLIFRNGEATIGLFQEMFERN